VAGVVDAIGMGVEGWTVGEKVGGPLDVIMPWIGLGCTGGAVGCTAVGCTAVGCTAVGGVAIGWLICGVPGPGVGETISSAGALSRSTAHNKMPATTTINIARFEFRLLLLSAISGLLSLGLLLLLSMK
jgi:hypothetical protein